MDGGWQVPLWNRTPWLVSGSWQSSLSYGSGYLQDEGGRLGVQAGAGYCAWEVGACQTSEQEGAPFPELRAPR